MEPVLIPVSFGELIDRITILELKIEALERAGRWEDVQRVKTELQLLRRDEPDVAKKVLSRTGLFELVDLMFQLRDINQQLWEVEDWLRGCEQGRSFGAAFVEAARNVYKLNDARAAVKLEINRLVGSSLAEMKVYKNDLTRGRWNPAARVVGVDWGSGDDQSVISVAEVSPDGQVRATSE